MATGFFQSGFLGYDGEIKAELIENGAPSLNNIILTDQAWTVRVDWKTEGASRHFVEDAYETGQIKLSVFLERIGPGAGPTLPSATEPIDGGVLAGGIRTYTKDLNFAAGLVNPGSYTMTVMIQVEDSAGDAQAIAGFVELPMVLFIKHP